MYTEGYRDVWPLMPRQPHRLHQSEAHLRVNNEAPIDKTHEEKNGPIFGKIAFFNQCIMIAHSSQTRIWEGGCLHVRDVYANTLLFHLKVTKRGGGGDSSVELCYVNLENSLHGARVFYCKSSDNRIRGQPILCKVLC